MPDLIRYTVHHWWSAFLLTLVLEIPVYVLLTRGRVPAWRSAAAGVVCSAVTHPLLWFAWPRTAMSYAAYLVTGELLVIAAETAIFWVVAHPLKLRRAALVALAANAASCLVGILLQRLI
jgi:hypothetical protein